MTTTPRVSVLLPCRNAATTLDQAMGSLTAQTFRDLEIIAVDDGSTDGTPTLLSEWAAGDRRIRSYSIETGGIVTALNTGASHARAGMLARMDADDVAAPDRFERQLAFLDTHSDVAACGSGIRYFPRRHVRDGARRYERWINGVVTPEDIERDLFVECPIPHPTLVVRRGVFEAVGGYRDMGWPEDYDLIFRLWKAGHRLGKVPEVLLDWRERPDRLSRTDSRYTEDAFRHCKAHYLGPRIGHRDIVVWGAGPVGKAFSLALKKQGHRVVAFVDLDPRKIHQVIHEALVIHPSEIDTFRDAYFLAAVGSSEARADIRRALHAAGFHEPLEYCAVA